MAWSAPKIGAVAAVASGNITLAEPAGIASGDLMVACIGYRSNAVFTVPGDWTLVATQQSSGDTDATNGIASGLMMWCVRGGSAPTLTFTRTAGDVAQGQIVAYTGGHATPFDVGSANTLAIASATVTTGTFTTAEAGELIVAMASCGDNLTTSAFDAATDPATASGATDTTTAPTNGTWIERADTGTGTGADHGLAIADAVRATAGATGTIQATVSAIARHVMIAAAFKLAPPLISLAGSSAGTGTAAADVQLTKNLSGSSAGTSTATADLGITKNLAGASAGTSTADADLSIATLIELAGSSDGTSTASADVAVTKNLAGSSAGVSTAAATFSITKNFGAASAGTSTAGGTLLVTKNFAGVSVGSSTATAVLSITHNLSGSSAGTSTANADLSVTEIVTISFAGTSNGVATAAATLTVSSVVLTPPLTVTLNSGERYARLSAGERSVELEAGERFARLED